MTIRCWEPRIHGEVLKLGFEVAQSSFAKYMVKRCGPPSPGWRAPSCVTMRPTSPPWTCSLARALASTSLWPRHRSTGAPKTGLDQRHTTSDRGMDEWIARQVTEEFPWAKAPRYLIRDRDRVYSAVVTHRLQAMGIRDKAHCPRLALAERLRRKIDRIDSSRVCRPYCRLGRSALTPGPDEVCRLLQRVEDSAVS